MVGGEVGELRKGGWATVCELRYGRRRDGKTEEGWTKGWGGLKKGGGGWMDGRIEEGCAEGWED